MGKRKQTSTHVYVYTKLFNTTISNSVNTLTKLKTILDDLVHTYTCETEVG